MKYIIEIMPRAVKDLKALPKTEVQKIADAINHLEFNLKGDVKKLTNYSPEYRLRVGNYRILFEVEDTRVVIYRIRTRKDAYRFGG